MGHKQMAMTCRRWRISCTISTEPEQAWSEPRLRFTPSAINSGSLFHGIVAPILGGTAAHRLSESASAVFRSVSSIRAVVRELDDVAAQAAGEPKR